MGDMDLLGPVTALASYDPTKCKAWSRSRPGNQCGNSPVPGLEVCRFHGGGSKKARDAGQRELERRRAVLEVQRFALRTDVAPSEALLEEVRWTAGHVEYLRMKVQDLGDDELVWGTIKDVSGWNDKGSKSETVDAAAISIWYQLYLKEREHLVRVSEAAVRAGVEQRRVELAEQQGLLVATVLERILNGLHDALVAAGFVISEVWEEKVRTIVPHEMRALEPGTTPREADDA